MTPALLDQISTQRANQKSDHRVKRCTPKRWATDERPLVVLGAGVAGLAAAYAYTHACGGRVILVEQGASVGGLAASGSFAGVDVDLGSHRIHPNTLPHVLQLLRDLLGSDLLRRPRQGRLHLSGRTMSYPPNVVDFVSTLGAGKVGRCGASLLGQRLRERAFPEDLTTFEGYLTHKVGPCLFSLFYEPYARKVYGIDPGRLAVRAAKTRVSTGRPAEVAKWAVRKVRGSADDSNAYFYYPRDGFRSIGDALLARIDPARIEVLLNTEVVRVNPDSGQVLLRSGGSSRTIDGSSVVSSIPIERLARVADDTPASVIEASSSLRWRSVRVLLLHVNAAQCLEGDTHYLPEARFLFGRVSEPHRFSQHQSPGPNQSILRVEVICSVGDQLWSMPEDALLSLLLRQLEEAGIHVPKLLQAESWSLPSVYPVYTCEAEGAMATISDWLGQHPRLASIGRGGMFMHGNVDHSIHVGLEAGGALARCQVPSTSATTLAGFSVRD